MPHIVCDIRAINVGILRQSHRGTFGGRQIVTGGIPGARWCSPPADTVGGASTRINSGFASIGCGAVTWTQKGALKWLWSVRAAYQCVAGLMIVRWSLHVNHCRTLAACLRTAWDCEALGRSCISLTTSISCLDSLVHTDSARLSERKSSEWWKDFRLRLSPSASSIPPVISTRSLVAFWETGNRTEYRGTRRQQCMSLLDWQFYDGG